MSESQTHGVHRFALFTAGTTVLLLMAGALVTSNDAADSVPDWPLAYGRLIPPLVGGIRFEFTHRVIAGIVAVLTTILAIWLARVEPQRAVRRLGWTALALVLAQAILGGIRVLLGHPAQVATAHAALAQIFFLSVVTLAVTTSDWWRRTSSQLDDSGSPRLRSLSVWTTIVIFVQIILGAAFRHGAFGILPHLIGAVVVLFFVIWTGRTVRMRFGENRDLRRNVALLHAFFGTQFLLGGAAYWAVLTIQGAAQPTLAYVIISVAHVLFGALTLAASLLLTLSCFRLIRVISPLAVNSTAERARS
jgi:heme a synthase